MCDVPRSVLCFWHLAYLNSTRLLVLCGSIWSPFTHIAANLFQVRYGYTEADASWTASFLHAGSLVLYPIVRIHFISPRLAFDFPSSFRVAGWVHLRPIAARVHRVQTCALQFYLDTGLLLLALASSWHDP